MLPHYGVCIAAAAAAVAGIALLILLWATFSDSRLTRDKDDCSDTSKECRGKESSVTVEPEAVLSSHSASMRRRAAADNDGASASACTSAGESVVRRSVATSGKSGIQGRGTALEGAATPARASKPAQSQLDVAPPPPTALQKRSDEWKHLWLLRQCATSRMVDQWCGQLDIPSAKEIKCRIWHMLDDRPKYVATGCADGQARIFELNTGRMLVSVRHDVSSRSAIGSILLASGPTMLTGTWDGRIHKWDEWPDKPARPEEFNRGEKYIGHDNQIVGLALSRDKNKIVSACSAGKVLILRRNCPTTEVEISDSDEIQRLKEVLKIGDHSELYLLEDIILGGRQLLSGDELLKEADFEGRGMRRDLDKLDLPARLRFRFAGCLSAGHPRSWRQLDHDDTVLCAALSAEGTGEFVYSGSRDRTVRKWDLADASHVHTYSGHSSMVRCLATNSRYLVSGGDDRKVLVWRKERPELIRTIVAHNDFVHAVALCQTFPERLVSAGYDGRVVLWDVSSGAEVMEYKHPAATAGPLATALLLHESLLLTCCTDKQLRVWCTETGRLERKMRHAESVTAASLI